jgi:ArsR family transcriptional regulator
MVRKLEKILKALGDKNRLRIVNMLRDKPMCVCEITDVLELSQSAVSGHLRVLKEAGVIGDRKDGLWVEYSLCRDGGAVGDLLRSIEESFLHDPEMKAERKLAGRTDRQALCKK